MADLLIGPVAQVEGTIRADPLGDRDEVGIVTAQEIIAVMAGVATAFGHDLI